MLQNALSHFVTSYLSHQDIHTIASACDTEVRKTILKGFFHAVAILHQRDVQNVPHGPPSALLSAVGNNKASMYALFGGQGTNEVYFDELQNLYDIYTPFVSAYITTLTNEVLKPLAAEEEESSYYAHGLDVISWLSGRIPRPSVAYLATVPLSLPLIGLTQLVQYLIVCRVQNVTPGQLRDKIAGATGHSQGIVSAVAVAASDSFESFELNSKKALKWLFYNGLRGQQAFPLVSLEPSIIQDCIDGGEGTPGPMLSVTGLALKELDPHIKKTNSHLDKQSQLHVSLHNGPRAFVVTGPAKALYGLVTNLRKIRAPSGTDQSKVPFSQRKATFSVRFLVVGVPYHNSHYLGDAVDDLLEDDLEGEELWKTEDIKIPVFNTEDGKFPFRSSYRVFNAFFRL